MSEEGDIMAHLFTIMTVLMTEIVRWCINLLIEQEQFIVMGLKKNIVCERLAWSNCSSSSATNSISTLEVSGSGNEGLVEIQLKQVIILDTQCTGFIQLSVVSVESPR